jgi:hypothetical protein
MMTRTVAGSSHQTLYVTFTLTANTIYVGSSQPHSITLSYAQDRR